MKLSRERMFIAIVLLAVIITPAFTIYYMHRVNNPIRVQRITQDVLLNDGIQTVLVTTTLRNRLPVHVNAKPVFNLPSDTGGLSFFHENMIIETERYPLNPQLEVVGRDMFTFEVKLPPFDDAKLIFSYGFKGVTDSIYLLDITQSLGNPGSGIFVELKLPVAVIPVDTGGISWQNGTTSSRHFKAFVRDFGDDGILEIPLEKGVTGG